MALTLSNSVLLKICLAMGLVFFGQLGYASLQLSKFPDPRANVNSINLFWNPFFDSDLSAGSALEVSIMQARQRLDFMTFPLERNEEVDKVLSALYAQLNINPFDSKVWDEVIQLQRESKPHADVRLWTLQAGLLLNGWQKQNRIRMAGVCIEDPPVVLETGSEVCKLLLKQVSESYIGRSALSMGVKSEFLKSRLIELNKIFGFSPESMVSNLKR